MSKKRILSPELLSEINEDVNLDEKSEFLVRPSGKKKKIKKEDILDPEIKEIAKKLSANQKKKLKILAERKENAEKRKILLKKIEEHQLSVNQLQALEKSGEIGIKKNTRERLKNIVRRAIVGIKPTENDLNEIEKNPKILAEIEESLGIPFGTATKVIKDSADLKFCQQQKVSEQRISSTENISNKTPPPKPKIIPNFFDSIELEHTSSSVHQSTSQNLPDGNSSDKTKMDESYENNMIEKMKDSFDSFKRKLEQEKLNIIEKRFTSISVSGTADPTKEIVPDVKSKKLSNGKKYEIQSLAKNMNGSSDTKKRQLSKPAIEKCVSSNLDACDFATPFLPTSVRKSKSGTYNTNDGKEINKKMQQETDSEDERYNAISYKTLSDIIDEEKFFKDCLPLKFCPVLNRPVGINDKRIRLPVCGMEQEIIEAIRSYDTVIVCAETGSGKSTQIPQFAYEAGYASNGMIIGATQPRRVAAVSTAARVAYEMGTTCDANSKGLVGYHIRYDNSTLSSETKIKFMTDGILLQELCADILLRKYSIIFLDEAHERGLNTDLLLGLLSRAVPLRRKLAKEAWIQNRKNGSSDNAVLAPLKIVIMSATLGVIEFASNKRLFPLVGPMAVPRPPVIKVPSRQYPVTVHFSRKTELYDYMGAAFQKERK